MPHVIVKMMAGRSEEEKVRLTKEVTKAVMAGLNCPEQSVSVGLEDVAKEDWASKVNQPDILAKPETIYKKPGTP